MRKIDPIQSASTQLSAVADPPQRRTDSSSGASLKPPTLPVSRVEKSPLEAVKEFFKPVLNVLSFILGVTKFDNQSYDAYLEGLNSQTQNVDAECLVYERAKLIVKKLSEGGGFFDQVERNLNDGKPPWEGLKPDVGIPMSGKLRFLGGDDLSKEVFYHNISEYQWANSQIEINEGKKSKIKTYVDGDNTSLNKSIDPEDTVTIQSEEKLFEDRKLIYLGNNKLNIQENANTARTGIVTNETTIVPEGLSRRISTAALPSIFAERIGATARTQYENSENIGVIALNGTVIHEPKEDTILKPELIEVIITDLILNSSIGPKINGKSMNEMLRDIAVEKGFSIFEPKLLPKLALESELNLGRYYHPHYMHIVKLKEEHVDNYIDGLKRSGKQVTESDYKTAWLNFQSAVKERLQSDTTSTPCKSQIWLPSTRSSEIAGIYEKIERSLNVKIPSSARLGDVNYMELLENDPQAFYSKVNEGVQSALVFHIFNNHGTPVEGAYKELGRVYEEFSNNPEFRRVQAVVSQAFEGTRLLRKGVKDLRDLAKDTYVQKGAKEYLDLRINQHLMIYFSEKTLSSLKTSTGIPIFNCKDKKNDLEFSEEFKALGNEVVTKKSFDVDGYVNWIKGQLRDCKGADLNCDALIDSVLPNGVSNFGIDFNSGNEEERARIADENPTIFYPNDYHIINSKRAYDGRYFFSVRRTIVDKNNDLNPEGQSYTEYQAPSEKHKALPDFKDVKEKGLILNAAGDSDSDMTMMASALERGGFVDIVLNQITNRKLFREMISQRREYEKEFKSDEEYQAVCKEFGIFGVRVEKKDSVTGELLYSVLTHFDEKGVAQYDEDNQITESDLIKQLEKRYLFNIIRHSSAEAYIRRRAESASKLTGESITFENRDLEKAVQAYKKQLSGQELSIEEEKLLYFYECSVIRQEEGNKFGIDAPHSNVCYEWHLKDAHGDFTVYRSKRNNGAYVIDRGNGAPLEEFQGDLSLLKFENRASIYRGNSGQFVQVNSDGIEVPYTNLDKLNDHVVESNIRPKSSPESGIFSSKLLKGMIGEKNLKKLVTKIPNMFQGLLRYSGLIIGAGGLLRLLSPFTFGMGETVYKMGYRTSNLVRAVSAFGGALRGALNVNRYWNITAGEAINIVASFMNDGVKHGFLGLGNFVLFLGRGQQATQRQQKVNNHPKPVLEADIQSPTFKEFFKTFVDPRNFARRVTDLGTSLVTKVKCEVSRQGLSPLIGEIAGSLLGAVLTPIQMIKDIVKDPRLISQIVERMSEKSGGFFKNIPSPGHLMTLVGAVSGLSTLVAGTFGRNSGVFGEVKESGFNSLGRWAISAACGIPALGIIANARDVMANIDGLPKQYRGLDGKEVVYNPKAAGLLQTIAGAGFAFSSLFDLSNKYAAALYDVANGLYFTGAAIEEGPNAYRTALSELRASNKLYEHRPDDIIHDFSDQDKAPRVEAA